MQDFKELQVGRIAKDLLLLRMKELELKTEWETKDVANFTAYTKLYLAMLDDMRKNLDADIERMKAAHKLGIAPSNK